MKIMKKTYMDVFCAGQPFFVPAFLRHSVLLCASDYFSASVSFFPQTEEKGILHERRERKQGMFAFEFKTLRNHFIFHAFHSAHAVPGGVLLFSCNHKSSNIT